MNVERIITQVEEILKQKEKPTQKLQLICNILQKEVSHYDWVGFYMLEPTTQTLKLGPYKGKPTTHTSIAVGKGVCGQVAQNQTTMIVQDVSKMENYIACSMEVQSEIVVPVFKNKHFVAEIDIDSHAYAPFGETDKNLLEEISRLIADLF